MLAWLTAKEQRIRGTLSADYHTLVLALDVDKGNLTTSLKGLEREGVIRV
jgi:hypothetical protein